MAEVAQQGLLQRRRRIVPLDGKGVAQEGPPRVTHRRHGVRRAVPRVDVDHKVAAVFPGGLGDAAGLW